MNRHRTVAVLLATAALASCSNTQPDPPANTATTSTAPATVDGKPHRVTYTLFGAATRLTYLGQAGNPITKNGPELGTIYTATLLDGDTAKIEATGDNPNTGLGCTISVDNNQVANETSYNAQAGVACTYTVH
jgi:hypothetical protein